MLAVVCYSRKRGAWVIYDRPSRRQALLRAQATLGTVVDRIEGVVKGSLPMAWDQRPGQYATRAEAEMHRDAA